MGLPASITCLFPRPTSRTTRPLCVPYHPNLNIAASLGFVGVLYSERTRSQKKVTPLKLTLLRRVESGAPPGFRRCPYGSSYYPPAGISQEASSVRTNSNQGSAP